MSYTLTYTPPGGGTPGTQTFAQWGIGLEWTVTFKEQQADAMTMTLPASAVAANPFQFMGTCVVKDDNGDIIFQGVLTTDPRAADVPHESIELTWSGPWWYLEGLPYEQLFPQTYGNGGVVETYQFLTHFVLNRSVNQGFVFSQAMISAILDFAIFKGAPIQYELLKDANGNPVPNTYFPIKSDGTQAYLGNFPDLMVLPEVVVNLSTAQALLRQVEDYDCVMYFDHTTTPPTFRVKHRGDANAAWALTAVTRSCSPLSPQTSPLYDVIGFNLKERYDLRVPYVKIIFEQSITINGQSLLTSTVDQYPNPLPAPPDSFYPLAATIPLPPITTNVQAQVMQTLPVIGPNGPAPGSGNPAAGPAEDLNFWQAVKPELANATEFAGLSIVPGSSTRQTSLPNVIISGSHCAWMGGNVQKETFTCQFNYTTKNGTQVKAHTLSVTKTATDLNAPNGNLFTSVTGNGAGEDAGSYAGMAQLIYADLNARQFEGTIPVYDSEWSGGIGPGCALSVANAFPDWAAMNATVREVAWQFGRGGDGVTPGVRGVIHIGPNKKLTPNMIMDRWKAWRLKFAQLYSFGASQTGSLGGEGEIQFPDAGPDTTPGQAHPNLLAQTVGNSGLPINPGEAGIAHVPNIPPAPVPPQTAPPIGQNLTYDSKSGLNQRDITFTGAEAAGVWGTARMVSRVNAQGYVDVGLVISKINQLEQPVGIAPTGPNIGQQGSPSYSDANGNPTGSISGQVVMWLSDCFGCNLSIRGVTGCDSTGKKLYMLVLGSAWSESPIPGITYDVTTALPS